MSLDQDDPFVGLGESDRIRKPTRFTAAQILVMAAAVCIVIGTFALVAGLTAWMGWKRGYVAILIGGFGAGCGVYRMHWRYRQRN